MIEQRAIARAIDAIRRGWPVTINSAITVLPIENATMASLAEFDPHAGADILISAGRAATLKLINQKDAAAPDSPVVIARTEWVDLTLSLAIADPALDLAYPMKGPFQAIACQHVESAQAALMLARHAGILPAFFLRPPATGEASVTSGDVALWENAAQVRIVSRARLPVAASPDAEIIAFRSNNGGEEHIALVIGSPNGTLPLVRIHSECLTGDVLRSLKCDCGPQLDAALESIAQSGWGILLYLRQEGRGIGLINKLRAYALQDQGFDTVDSNTRLGFAIDARDFGIAAAMLHALGQEQVQLLTNNPEKVSGLEVAGITVAARVPHVLPTNPHNANYLATKRDRTGHLI